MYSMSLQKQKIYLDNGTWSLQSGSFIIITGDSSFGAGNFFFNFHLTRTFAAVFRTIARQVEVCRHLRHLSYIGISVDTVVR